LHVDDGSGLCLRVHNHATVDQCNVFFIVITSMKRPHISEQQLSFCKRLKKIELHAHLNGSVRASTLRQATGRICMGVT
jgi:hypothetical protein